MLWKVDEKIRDFCSEIKTSWIYSLNFIQNSRYFHIYYWFHLSNFWNR